MYHSITIGEKNTWDDWHLVPTSRPIVKPPQVKTSYVALPGGDGVLDLTTAMAGRPTYGNRTGSWTFRVLNTGEYSVNQKDWTILYSEILAYLHGQEYMVTLEDDPGYYYKGRLAVSDWKSNPTHSEITINYNLQPYKKEVSGSDEDWLWDPFNFETGVIRYYKNIPVNGTASVLFINPDVMEIVPTFLCTAAMTVQFEGTTYSLTKGINTLARIRVPEGENTFIFTGNGYVTIQSEGGRF